MTFCLSVATHTEPIKAAHRVKPHCVQSDITTAMEERIILAPRLSCCDWPQRARKRRAASSRQHCLLLSFSPGCSGFATQHIRLYASLPSTALAHAQTRSFSHLYVTTSAHRAQKMNKSNRQPRQRTRSMPIAGLVSSRGGTCLARTALDPCWDAQQLCQLLATALELSQESAFPLSAFLPAYLCVCARARVCVCVFCS